MQLSRRSSLRAGAALAALAVFAGCGSSASKSPAAATGSASVITIGNIGSYTGPLSASGAGSIPGFLKDWVADINASGGINGHKINLIVKDDAGNASSALTAVRELVQQDKVTAIISDASYVDAAWASIPAAAGIPVIGGQSLTVSMESNPDFFPSGQTVLAQFYAALAIAKPFGPKFGLLYCAEAPVCAEADGILKYFAPGLGMQETGMSVSASAPNYTAPCQALINSGVQTVEYGQVGPVALRIANDCAAQGLKAHILETSGVANAQWLTDPAVAGELNVVPDAPTFENSSSGTEAYHAILKKYSLTDPDATDQEAYIGAELFAAAVKGVGGAPVTARSLKAALYAMKGQTLGGLTPPLTFSPGKPNAVNCWFETSITGGHFIAPSGLRTACAPSAAIAAAATKFGL